MQLFTIGYEAISYSELTEALHGHGIQTVLDVRQNPISRKPGFSKRALSLRLQSDGFSYEHMKDLGCPPEIREEYRDTQNWGLYIERFQSHLAQIESSLQALAYRTRFECCALMCFEANPNYCHRKLIAEAVMKLSIRHLKVTHISIASQAQAARRYARLQMA